MVILANTLLIPKRCLLQDIHHPLDHHNRPRHLRTCSPNLTGIRKDDNNKMNFGSSSIYVEEMYDTWRKDAKSVHDSWDKYFRTLSLEKHMEFSKKSLLTPINQQSSINTTTRKSHGEGGGSGSGANAKDIEDHLVVQSLINSYQARGHLVAQLDPLGILYPDRETTISDRYGHPPDKVTRKLKISDMERVFTLPPHTYIGGEKDAALPLKEIIRRLELVYCRHIGMEYMHLLNVEEIDWIRKRVEHPDAHLLDKESKIHTLSRLIRAYGLEEYFAKKWPGEKRFGLEGGEALIPLMLEIIDNSCAQDVNSFAIAMAHRGRLNVLTNVCRKPLEHLFTQFIGLEPESDDYAGDVKYHLGLETHRTNRKTGKKYKVSLVANPSHLECASPVLVGKVKCEQFYNRDDDGSKSLAMIIHGDAAVAGQGVVFETVHLSYLPCYTIHGSIHIVINNQIGFTTDPRVARSSPYCSDVSKSIQAPIFHVNGDDPESVVFVARLAADYRAKFHKDVFVDIVCYRKNGHNELDQPMFTQPLMYKRIAELKPVHNMYAEQLAKEGVIEKDYVDKVSTELISIWDEAFKKAKDMKTIDYSQWIDCPWKGFFKKDSVIESGNTGIPEEVVKHIVTRFSSPPPASLGFEIHKGIRKILEHRMKLAEKRLTNWAMGEAVGFSSLLKDGVHVRMSGEDCERGTFSHRHHILHHQTKDKETYNMLSNIFPDQAPYTVCNSSLSEFAVMGFEVGYSMANPRSLCLWEAQFGDFFNSAQVIIDQFVSAGEHKWVRQCGVVLTLPHGFEGMGPEHSSARMERFLQLSSEDIIDKPSYDRAFADKQLLDINWFIVNLTTPANLFHLYRRQLKLPFRKPIVYFSPKSLLKRSDIVSSFDEYLPGTEFQRLIPESGPASQAPDKVKRLIFCSGKVYYDIQEGIKDAKNADQVAVARVEQLTPFPYDLVQQEVAKYPNAKLEWVQEEPKNMGAWLYCRDRVIAAGHKEIGYIGRPCSASPATGNKVQHLREVKQLKILAAKLD